MAETKQRPVLKSQEGTDYDDNVNFDTVVIGGKEYRRPKGLEDNQDYLKNVALPPICQNHPEFEFQFLPFDNMEYYTYQGWVGVDPSEVNGMRVERILSRRLEDKKGVLMKIPKIWKEEARRKKAAAKKAKYENEEKHKRPLTNDLAGILVNDASLSQGNLSSVASYYS